MKGVKQIVQLKGIGKQIVKLQGMVLKVEAVPWSSPFDTRAVRVANNSASQTNECSGTACDASQTAPVIAAPPIEPPKKEEDRWGPEQNLSYLHMVLKWLLNQVATSECMLI
jgi:hypothetical protein